MNLYPLEQCARNASRLAARGCLCFQQFICASCKTKQTMEKPNIWHEQGKCEECSHITNIKKDGCNYLVVASTPEAQEALWKLTQD